MYLHQNMASTVMHIQFVPLCFSFLDGVWLPKCFRMTIFQKCVTVTNTEVDNTLKMANIAGNWKNFWTVGNILKGRE